jgi:hypothetical protein
METPESPKPPASPSEENIRDGKRSGFWPCTQRFFQFVREIYDAAKPCRLALCVSLLVPIVFIANQQAAELLRCLGEGPGRASLSAQWKSAAFWQFAEFYLALAAMSTAGWYFSRVLLYCRFPDSPAELTRTVTRVMTWLPRLIGILPPLGLGIAFLLAADAYHDDNRDRATRNVLYLEAAACFLLAIPLLIFYLERHRIFSRARGVHVPHLRFANHVRELPRKTLVVLSLSWLGATTLFLGFVFSPVALAQTLSAGVVILAAAFFWICHGSIVVYLAHRVRLPVFVPILLLLALMSLWNDNHEVRRLPGAKPAFHPTLAQHYSGWYSNLCARYPDEKEHPVIIVATAGGGIRAGFWTAVVLGRLQDRNPNFAPHVFAISGVSGGSLGAAVFEGLVAQGIATNHVATAWRILSQDFLSPPLAYMLFPDLVARCLPFPMACFDRSRALEMSWERAWASHLTNNLFAEDFNNLWSGPRRYALPSLFLNGTSVETGKRMILSNVEIDPTFVDALDVNERLAAPLAVSTAVHMSARFTYLSPAGRFTNGEHIVDGGYFENSGSATAWDILNEVCRQNQERTNSAYPIIILIRNDPAAVAAYRPHAGSEFLGELAAPVNTLVKTREARGTYSEISFANHDAIGNTNYCTFSLSEPPTNAVPLPLGWSLSRAAMREMMRQLREQTDEVEKVIRHLPPKP